MGLMNVVKTIKDRNNRSFLVTSHQNMEGDAIGSMLALSELLKAAGKKVILLPPENMPDIYNFLPDSSKVKLRKDLRGIKYDVACLVDCTDLDRLGQVKSGIYSTRPILNIDHHISNTNFGSVNWVDPHMSCSGEQIYHLFKKMALPINKRAALYMYIAILTDTGSFRYSNTTAMTHEIAAELISLGVNPLNVYRKIYEEISPSSLSLLSSVLSTLNTASSGRIAWIRITRSMLKRHSSGLDDTQDFVNFPRAIKGVKISIVFKETKKGVIKAGFRSNDGFDVNRIARHFGGGGHTSASGCTLKGTMGEVERAVLIKAKAALKSVTWPLLTCAK
jgi:bifunctional oligoribonuclease and PAP phosphatase NrnA